jgi:NAD(P)-dependent dehydrogenase (short-subunit alcohol dehydrogenase family)
VAYVASKHGVLGLVKAASIDLAPKNIRINSICPGVVETPLMGPARESEEGLKLLASMQVLRRYAQPEELAAFAAFLSSDEASYMTGEVVTVDGGVSNLMNISLPADFVTSITD